MLHRSIAGAEDRRLSAVELVPAPFTRADVVDAAAELLTAAGMSVVRVRKEIEGFVFNRLQGALLREAYCLVRGGIVDVDDVDRVVRDGSDAAGPSSARSRRPT